MTETTKSELKSMSVKIFVVVITLVVSYCLLILFLTWPVTEFSMDKAAKFGDSFGVITSLFSGLAFSGLIITILLQSKELSLQREELALTRAELAKSVKAQQQQVHEMANAAKLNALGLLVQACAGMVAAAPNSAAAQAHLDKYNRLILDLDKLYNELSSS